MHGSGHLRQAVLFLRSHFFVLYLRFIIIRCYINISFRGICIALLLVRIIMMLVFIVCVILQRQMALRKAQEVVNLGEQKTGGKQGGSEDKRQHTQYLERLCHVVSVVPLFREIADD